MKHLWHAAEDVLNANWTGGATLPSRRQYPHQWSWDSAFNSIGWARLAPDRARTELRSLFEGQWASGRVPQIIFNPDVDPHAYFPGPDFWRTTTIAGAPPTPTSGIVQPPIHARAALATYLADPQSDASMDFLRALYPRLRSWHGYLRQHRDIGAGGLAAIVHPWESGLDNSPLWDHVLGKRIGDGQAEDYIRRDLTHIDTSHRPTDADYRAYVVLASHYRDTGYRDEKLNDHRFIVEDPLFNAVLLDAELCCARIAELLGQDPRPHRAAARGIHHALVTRLWDSEANRFAARDVRTGALSQTPTIGSLIPLLDPWLTQQMREQVLRLAYSEEFAGGCEYPMPSTALRSPDFDRYRYWRGPTWISTNWLMWTAATAAGADELAGIIARASIELVDRAGFREYYDPLDGAGLGSDLFSWTAALTLDFLASTGVPTDTAAG